MKAEQVATFLGKKITPQLAQEIGSRFQTRIQGTCIKHRLGQAQVKMYDKVGLVLRIETTVNNVSFFKHHRKVEHRQGRSTRQLAPLKNRSTASSTCARSSSGATAGISSSFPPSRITAPACGRSTA